MSIGKPTVKHADINEMSFERAMKELETIVGRLERGDVELEESIVIWERGEQLKEHCDKLLRHAEAKVVKLTFDQDGHKGDRAARPRHLTPSFRESRQRRFGRGTPPRSPVPLCGRGEGDMIEPNIYRFAAGRLFPL